jgi:hypothetical protein
MHPRAKVVLVWPSDVIPIGGDARVDPADILHELGPAVGRALGLDAEEPVAALLTLPSATHDERAEPVRHASAPGELARVLPGPGLPRTVRDEAVVVDREPAPLLILPVTPSVDEDG